MLGNPSIFIDEAVIQKLLVKLMKCGLSAGKFTSLLKPFLSVLPFLDREGILKQVRQSKNVICITPQRLHAEHPLLLNFSFNFSGW